MAAPLILYFECVYVLALLLKLFRNSKIACKSENQSLLDLVGISKFFTIISVTNLTEKNEPIHVNDKN